jgi:hypothetical protein
MMTSTVRHPPVILRISFQCVIRNDVTSDRSEATLKVSLVSVLKRSFVITEVGSKLAGVFVTGKFDIWQKVNW